MEINDLGKEKEKEPESTPKEIGGRIGANDAVVRDDIGAGFAYLRFVLNPDTEDPVRMPAKFVYPSTFVSFKNNFTLTVGSAGDFVGYFSPQNGLNNSAAFSTDYLFLSRNTGSPAYNTQSYRYMANTAAYNPILGNSQFVYPTVFNSARVIGALCEIKYMGALQLESGSIIVSGMAWGSNCNPIGSGSVAINTPGAPGVNSPPTVSDQYNAKIIKKYSTGETIRMVWFPVDYSCTKFVSPPSGNNTNVSTVVSFGASQLAFYITGYGLPVGTQYDIRIQIYYEAVPNLANTSLFAASQSCEQCDWKNQWSQLNTIAQNGLGRLLLSGVK